MKNRSELHQIVYSLLAAQIEFGTYRLGDPLPKMEETARWLSVSLDTVRSAYLQLKRDGYITLTKKAGAAVAVRFQESEFEEHIQTFFALRKDAVTDLCRSLDPLFRHAQWFALKHAGPERLDELERLCLHPETLPPICYGPARPADLRGVKQRPAVEACLAGVPVLPGPFFKSAGEYGRL